MGHRAATIMKGRRGEGRGGKGEGRGGEGRGGKGRKEGRMDSRGKIFLSTRSCLPTLCFNLFSNSKQEKTINRRPLPIAPPTSVVH